MRGGDEDDRSLESLRGSVHRGRPFGQPVWQKQIAKRLGLESAYRPSARPRKVGHSPSVSQGKERKETAGTTKSGPVPLPPGPAR
jgi:hypothetical protein